MLTAPGSALRLPFPLRVNAVLERSAAWGSLHKVDFSVRTPPLPTQQAE